MFGAMGFMAALALGAAFVPMMISENNEEDDTEFEPNESPNEQASVPVETQIPSATQYHEINGDDEANEIYGESVADLIRAYGGDDHIIAQNGNDQIYAGDGNDVVKSGLGDDQLWGEESDDLLVGGEGDDTLFGGEGDDELYGWDDDDVIYTGHGTDEVFAGHGNDIIYSEDDGTQNVINGGTGDDTIYAGNFDLVDGGSGSDSIYAQAQAQIEITGFASGSDKLLIMVPPQEEADLPPLRIETDPQTGTSLVYSGNDLVATLRSGTIQKSDISYVFVTPNT